MEVLWSPFGAGSFVYLVLSYVFRRAKSVSKFVFCQSTHPLEAALLYVAHLPKTERYSNYCHSLAFVWCGFFCSHLPYPPCSIPFLPLLHARTQTNHAHVPNINIPSAGAASNDSCGPTVRLLRGVKAAGGTDGARRLEALARRLPMERAALETAAAAGAAEAREWRASVAEQAEAVVALGQVRRSEGVAGAGSIAVPYLQRCFE